MKPFPNTDTFIMDKDEIGKNNNMSLWSRFTSWISGWPEGSKERIQKAPAQHKPKEIKIGKKKNKEKRTRKQGNLR